MNIGQICTREVVFAERSSSLQRAAALMREHHVGTVLVVDRGDEGMQVTGIVTDRDIVVEAVARGADVTRTQVGQLTNGQLLAVPAAASVDDAISLMKNRGVRRLLVSGDDGELHGIVALDDLLGAVAHEMAELAFVVHKEIERETAERDALKAQQQPQSVRIPPYAIG